MSILVGILVGNSTHRSKSPVPTDPGKSEFGFWVGGYPRQVPASTRKLYIYFLYYIDGQNLGRHVLNYLPEATAARHQFLAEWSIVDNALYFRGKIYVPDRFDLRRRIVSLCHDTKVAGHAGRWKTLELISRNYWWPRMSKYVGTYVSTCDGSAGSRGYKPQLFFLFILFFLV
jgi:hypothetical protein